MSHFSLILRILLAVFLIFVPLNNFDQWLYDHLSILSPHSLNNSPFLLVRISEGKLSQYLENYPSRFPRDSITVMSSGHSVWSSHFYEPLLNKIKIGNPKLVVFTSFFDWVDQSSNLNYPFPTIFSSWIDPEGKLVIPQKSLTEADNYGFNNLFPDPDNVYRQTQLVWSSSPSLALQIHRSLKLSPPTSDLVEPIHVSFAGPALTFPSIDAWDLLEGTVEASLVKDKILLIGREGSPSLDVETPMGKMSQLEIQANIIRSFVEERQIRFLKPLTRHLYTLTSVIISVMIILYFPLSVAWFFLLGLAVCFSLCSWSGLYVFRVWTGLANPLLCILGTHLLLIGFKIAKEEEKQWRIQEESKYLKEMDQFKNNFVSLFSHDLKTPIAKIKAILDRLLAENPELPTHLKEGFQGIERANSELSRLISDILRVTKMESMPIEPAKEVVDINRLVESALQRLKFLFEEKQISITQDLEPLFSIEGDPHLLLEVIINLIENAIKYSSPGSQVWVQTREETGQIKVSVRDEGPGIPDEELPRVTSKFYRGKAADRTTRGSGLGLYLAKYFVELHGGALSLQSKVGAGTEISFTLPIT